MKSVLTLKTDVNSVRINHPAFIRVGWGFTIETATLGVRLVLSGVFEAHPNLKIILGHLGEGLPFLLWRMDHVFSRDNPDYAFREIFRKHFWVTTSGNFSDPAACLPEGHHRMALSHAGLASHGRCGPGGIGHVQGLE